MRRSIVLVLLFLPVLEQGCTPLAIDEIPDAESAALSPAAGFSAPDLVILDEASLEQIERSGYALDRIFGATDASARALSRTGIYDTVNRALSADLNKLVATPRRPSETETSFEGTWFDPEWLSSSSARFELVAVVNRIDQIERTPHACGETRLVYRLAYSTGRPGLFAPDAFHSRLPMTMSVVFENAPDVVGSCNALASAWRARRSAASDATPLLRQLTHPTRVEINLQSFRSEKGLYPVYGGRAEYLLRVFAVDGDRATPTPLANTPAPNLDATQTAALLAYLKSHAREVDTGSFSLPAEFAAIRTKSVAPYDLALDENRPYARYFAKDGSDFSSLSFQSMRTVKSPKAFLRRLDEMTCGGCHVSRSLAGFHVVGRDEADDARTVGIEVGVSPHFIANVSHRRAVLDALARGERVSATTYPEPFAERPVAGPGGFGEHCGLGDAGFAAWTCASGLECKRFSGADVGACTHPTPQLADACHFSDIATDTGYAKSDPDEQAYDWSYDDESRDGWAQSANRSMWTVPCNAWPDGIVQHDDSPTAHPPASGTVANIWIPNIGSAISDCYGGIGPAPTASQRRYAGSATTFAECLTRGAHPTTIGLQRCDAATPCRDSYTCARVVGAPAGNGACVPPYLLPSMQLFGHNVPF